jgi:hypothetical protein
VIDDVRQERIVAAGHEVLLRGSVSRQVVGTSRDHVADAAARIADIAG